MIREAMQGLVDHITLRYPGARVELEPWCSALFVKVFIEGRHFVLEFRPGEGFGVSEVVDEVDAWTGHSHAFKEFEEARSKFLEMIASRDSKQR